MTFRTIDATPTPPPKPREDRVIRAYKHGWPRQAVHAMILWKLRRHFYRVRAQGLGPLRDSLERDPRAVLILANHSSWWDFFMAHLLNETIPVDGYGMTEHFNMEKFGFFRRIGAYSVDRTDPRAVMASIDYTIELLSRPRAGVWLFPQGKIVCNDARPLTFQGGLRAILRRAGSLRVIPAALRYEYWQDERPEACVRFGASIDLDACDRAGVVERMERRLTVELDDLRADVLTQDASRFETILSGRGSVHDRYAALTARLLGKSRGTGEGRDGPRPNR